LWLTSSSGFFLGLHVLSEPTIDDEEVVDRRGSAGVEVVLGDASVASPRPLSAAVMRERVFDRRAAAQLCAALRRLLPRGPGLQGLFVGPDVDCPALFGARLLAVTERVG
jgi:hypothetical protein